MAYKHILIAVDLSPESKVLVDKAVSMARPYNAKVSLIHVDVNYSDLYTGLIDVNLGDMQKRISEETHHALSELSTNAGYPITFWGQSVQALAIDPSYEIERVIGATPGSFADALEEGGARVLALTDPTVLPKACKNPVEQAGHRAACTTQRLVQHRQTIRGAGGAPAKEGVQRRLAGTGSPSG